MSAKAEARILASKCVGNYCCGYIVRWPGVDGFLVATSCSELCITAKARGYMDELRYHYGECSCDLPKAPLTLLPKAEVYAKIAGDICSKMGRVEPIVGPQNT